MYRLIQLLAIGVFRAKWLSVMTSLCSSIQTKLRSPHWVHRVRWDFLLGPDAMTALQGQQTFSQTSSSCTDAGANSSTEFNGFIREEVVTFDIGTTATYTNSNPLVGALGADIGILLTELGAMYVPECSK